MYQRILVPVDGSPTSDRGLDEAIRLARMAGAQIRLIHVIDNLSMALSMDGYTVNPAALLDVLREAGTEIVQRARDKVAAQGVAVDTALHDNFEGAVHDVVVAQAQSWKADLIVIGTHGRRGVGRMFLGSSAERILRTATVPVLLVRAPEPAAAQA